MHHAITRVEPVELPPEGVFFAPYFASSSFSLFSLFSSVSPSSTSSAVQPVDFLLAASATRGLPYLDYETNYSSDSDSGVDSGRDLGGLGPELLDRATVENDGNSGLHESGPSMLLDAVRLDQTRAFPRLVAEQTHTEATFVKNVFLLLS